MSRVRPRWCIAFVAVALSACSGSGAAHPTTTAVPPSAHARAVCSALAVVFTAPGQAPTAAEGQALLAAAGRADNKDLKAEARGLLAASVQNDTTGAQHALA